MFYSPSMHGEASSALDKTMGEIPNRGVDAPSAMALVSRFMNSALTANKYSNSIDAFALLLIDTK